MRYILIVVITMTAMGVFAAQSANDSLTRATAARSAQLDAI